MLHSDGDYYLSATVPEYDRIELRRAKSLGELGKVKAEVIWKKHDKGPMSHHIWAPGIHFINGKWYIYFVAGKAEAVWDIRMYVLENASQNPFEGKWERIGHNVNEGPSVIHRNGHLFMTYSASATDANYCLGLLTADQNADLLDPASWKKSPEPVFKGNAVKETQSNP